MTEARILVARTLACAIIIAVATAGIARAQIQTPAGITRRSFDVRADSLGASRSISSAAQPGGRGAFAIEALGGSLGSLAGVSVVALSRACGNDDLGCVIFAVAAGGVGGAIGATIGTELTAHHTGSKRSVLGAALGAVVGTGVGVGVHFLVNRNSDRNVGDPVVIPIFVISQGTFAAIGSRLLGTAR